MIVDALALLLIAGLGYLGWRRGWVLMALSLVGFFAGYVAALLLHRPVGGLLASYAGMPQVLAYPIGGVLAMLVVSLAFRYARRRFRHRLRRKERDGWEHSEWDRAGGAAIGTVVALGVAMVVVWAATAVTELAGRPVPTLSGSRTARAGAALAEPTIYAALRLASVEPQLAASVSGIMARPGEAASSIQRVMQSDLFGSLRGDSSFRQAFLSGDAQRIQSHPLTSRMLEDEAFRRAFDNLNMMRGEAEEGSATPDFAATLGLFGGGMSVLQGDTQFQGSPLATQIQQGISDGSLDLVSITRSPQIAEMLTKINASFRAREQAVEEVIR